MKINSIGINYYWQIKLSDNKTQSNPLRIQPLTADVVSFSQNKREKTAKTAMAALEEHIKANTPLSQTDEAWLSPLRNLFGADYMEVKNPDNPHESIRLDSRLTREKVNNNMLGLYNALSVMTAASKYKPIKKEIGGITYTIHNPQIASLLKANYTSEDFSKLLNYLRKKGVFDMSDDRSRGLVVDNESGLVKICGASENWEMSDRMWITDAMRIGDIQKVKRPETWAKLLNTIADYYETQDTEFQTLIKNKDLYRKGGTMAGIPHIFLPKTLEPDKDWFNNKRLESHGLALKEFAKIITDSFYFEKPYGYVISGDVPDNMLLAMDNLSKFFKAIDYPTAPSAGNWEEIPLEGGLTSDTETIRSALCAYKDLLYNPLYDSNQEIGDIRSRIMLLQPLSEAELDDLIKRGEQRVRKTYLQEAPKIRPHDASLVFITTSDVKLADNIFEDIEKHAKILKSLEKTLVRKNGMLRYSPFKFKLSDGTYAASPDSYLNLNYFVALDKNGKINLDWKNVLDTFASKDCSDPEMFNARASLSTPNREAQWFMVSEMSSGYGMQILKLIKNARKEKRQLSSQEIDFIKSHKLFEKQTEYLNRALARISAENPDEIGQIKGNGYSMPPVTLSEAFQYVTDLNGKYKMVQGTNAPLAWALASLYKALSIYKAVNTEINP